MPGAEDATETKGRTTIKDVLASTDEAGAVSNYLEALRTGADRESLQMAMAETLNRLGNTGRALEFTLLAGQTKNAEYMGRVAGAFEDGVGKLGSRLEGFSDSVAKMSTASSRLQEAGDRMAGAAARMSSR